jgi:hypothetical protein
MNKRYEEIKLSIERYNKNRKFASEVLDMNGMEEAMIDELESRGFVVEEST